MTNWSKEPWSYTNTEDETIGLPCIYDGKTLRIAEVHGEDNTQREANARLMCAAPKLVKALTKLLDMMDNLGCEPIETVVKVKYYKSVYQNAVNVLHDATGEYLPNQ